MCWTQGIKYKAIELMTQTCEFLSNDLRGSHTEVDVENGHLWSERLAEQERRVATDENSLILQAEVVYEGYKDHKCPRLNVKGHQCQGKTVIRSFSLERRTGTIERLFIGCEHYQGREKGHMFFSIQNVDIPALLRNFGPC